MLLQPIIWKAVEVEYYYLYYSMTGVVHWYIPLFVISIIPFILCIYYKTNIGLIGAELYYF